MDLRNPYFNFSIPRHLAPAEGSSLRGHRLAPRVREADSMKGILAQNPTGHTQPREPTQHTPGRPEPPPILRLVQWLHLPPGPWALAACSC